MPSPQDTATLNVNAPKTSKLQDTWGKQNRYEKKNIMSMNIVGDVNIPLSN